MYAPNDNNDVILETPPIPTAQFLNAIVGQTDRKTDRVRETKRQRTIERQNALC